MGARMQTRAVASIASNNVFDDTKERRFEGAGAATFQTAERALTFATLFLVRTRRPTFALLGLCRYTGRAVPLRDAMLATSPRDAPKQTQQRVGATLVRLRGRRSSGNLRVARERYAFLGHLSSGLKIPSARLGPRRRTAAGQAAKRYEHRPRSRGRMLCGSCWPCT